MPVTFFKNQTHTHRNVPLGEPGRGGVVPLSNSSKPGGEKSRDFPIDDVIEKNPIFQNHAIFPIDDVIEKITGFSKSPVFSHG